MKAAEMDTSVSALVRQFLAELDTNRSSFEKLKRDERAARKRVVGFDASDRLSRDQVHERERGS